MSNRQVRLTVVGSRRSLDLAVPAGVAIAILMRDLLTLADELRDGDSPRAWGLARLGQGHLPPERSLRDIGVADGETLYIRELRRADGPARVEDVIELVQDTVGAGDAWGVSAARRLRLSVAGGVLTLTSAVAALQTPASARRTAGIALLAVSVVLLASGLTIARRRLAAPVAQALALLSWPAGVAGTVLVVTRGGSWAAGALAAGFAAWLALLALSAVVVPAVRPLAAGLVPGLVLAAGATLAVHSGVGRTTVAAVTALLALYLLGVLPRAVAAVGGVADLDDRAVEAGAPDSAAALTVVRTARRTLRWAVMGAALAGVVPMLILARTDRPIASVFVALLGVAFILRARGYNGPAEVAVLSTTGMLALAVALLAWLRHDPPGSAVTIGVGAAALAVLVLVGAALWTPSRVLQIRLQRLIDFGERLVAVSLLPVLAGVLDLYAAVAHRFGG